MLDINNSELLTWDFKEVQSWKKLILQRQIVCVKFLLKTFVYMHLAANCMLFLFNEINPWIDNRINLIKLEMSPNSITSSKLIRKLGFDKMTKNKKPEQLCFLSEILFLIVLMWMNWIPFWWRSILILSLFLDKKRVIPFVFWHNIL